MSEYKKNYFSVTNINTDMHQQLVQICPSKSVIKSGISGLSPL